MRAKKAFGKLDLNGSGNVSSSQLHWKYGWMASVCSIDMMMYDIWRERERETYIYCIFIYIYIFIFYLRIHSIYTGCYVEYIPYGLYTL